MITGIIIAFFINYIKSFFNKEEIKNEPLKIEEETLESLILENALINKFSENKNK